MAQSSAAREPTMEEILASIRRIIESNDDAATQRAEQRPKLASIDGGIADEALSDSDVEAVDEPSHPDGLDDVLKADESAMQSALLEEAVTTASVAGGAEASRTVSLADVAARLRTREGQAPVGAEVRSVRQEPAVAAHEEPEDVEDDAPEARYPSPVGVPESAANDAGAPNGLLAGQMQGFSLAEAAAEPDEETDLPSRAGEVEAIAELDENEEAGERAAVSTGAALVSAVTDTKVAAAFEELDDAIAKGRMRSFDEIAQEMLRPMLSEWLDDNLPTLVERLVREEIERVARGGGRR